jgi:hypothetical protein
MQNDKLISLIFGLNNSAVDMRESCIEVVKLFFDCDLNKEKIIDETVEVFFENNPDKKFFQFFFKSDHKSFKIRVLEKNTHIFHIYQSLINSPQVFPSMTKENSKALANLFLSQKFNDYFKLLTFDKDYLDITMDMNKPEFHTFRFIFENFYLYITIDVNCIDISQIYIKKFPQ